jgi:hypothetical protein
MTTFRPCIGCIARNDCEIKKGVMKALRGQPVTSAKIKCALPFTRDFPAGTRVTVKVYDQREFDANRGDAPAKMVPSTVVGPSSKKAGKLLLFLDEPVSLGGDHMMEFRAEWPKNVVRLDEPRGDYCSSCKRAFVKDRCSCRDDDYGMGW